MAKFIVNELRDIDNIPRNVTDLKFYINHPINTLQGLSDLTCLEFDFYFDHPIDMLQNLTNLTHLYFGHCFNQPINILQHLTNLKHLRFGNYFNQPITTLEHLTNLTHLEFESIMHQGDFNQPIDVLQYLTNLKHLSLCCNFNKNLDVFIHLVNLEYLKLNSDSFDQPLKLHSNLTNLKTLRLDGTFFERIDLSNLTNLIRIEFNTFQSVPFKCPRNIQEITIDNEDPELFSPLLIHYSEYIIFRRDIIQVNDNMIEFNFDEYAHASEVIFRNETGIIKTEEVYNVTFSDIDDFLSPGRNQKPAKNN